MVTDKIYSCYAYVMFLKSHIDRVCLYKCEIHVTDKFYGVYETKMALINVRTLTKKILHRIIIYNTDWQQSNSVRRNMVLIYNSF